MGLEPQAAQKDKKKGKKVDGRQGIWSGDLLFEKLTLCHWATEADYMSKHLFTNILFFQIIDISRLSSVKQASLNCQNQ